MTGFISLKTETEELIDLVVKHPDLHGRWINTLSYLENCGARLIASCEHPTAVKEEMLKHASEEFRHAFYLKKQLRKIGQFFEDYRLSSLLGGWAAYHYLNRLNLYVSRYLETRGLAVKELAYLLVTYAIELRASELYPLYQSALRRIQSKVQVQSILLEEKEHLEEMEEGLNRIEGSTAHIQAACQFEAVEFKRFATNAANLSKIV